MWKWKFDWLQTKSDRRPPFESYAFKGADIKADITSKYGAQGDLVDIYSSVAETLVHKWHHYLPIYDRYLAPWRNRHEKPLRLLEIGVSQGGSLEMWRRYFGQEAIIFGIDINPACAIFNGRSGAVRIGSQDDPEFLKSVVAEMGGVDVVIDDGSHEMGHIKASLLTLFPLLSLGGTYVIEDLLTAYWREFGGGLTTRDNFFVFLRHMIDDMHHWYHRGSVAHLDMSRSLTGLHVHDSMVILDKSPVFAPVHSRIGTATTRRA